MLASLGGIFIGLLVGIRHAFEPDHLSAVSTLVTEAGSARRGAMLGVAWGLGHTVSLVVVGAVLLAVGGAMPEHLAAAFECGVALMLVFLGTRSVVRALREGREGAATAHAHAGVAHTHVGPPAHVHVGRATLAWRPLAVGLVHGLAGSGALTALVFARLPDTVSRVVYMVVFGIGSIAGMAIATGAVGASVKAVAAGARARRRLGLATGALAIVIGVVWAVPMIAILA